MSCTAPRIVIVDDDPSIRRTLSKFLKAEGYQVETYGSADEFLDGNLPPGPCCLVLDVIMPGMSGPQLQSNLNKFADRYPIVFISGSSDIPTAVHTLKSGAVDFLTKPVEPEALLKAIEKALEDASQGRKDLDKMMRIRGRLMTLTEREREVFDLIVLGARNKEIASTLGIKESTVRAHRANAMEKLKVRSSSDLLDITTTLKGLSGV